MYIERELSQKLLTAAKHFPAVVLTGARQVGKSTFLRKMFPDHHYVTLDSPMTAEEAETNPEVFLRKNQAPLIIDEVQYAPGLFRFLKMHIDAQRDDRGRYILTGSQKFELMQGVSESLAGRIAVLEMEGTSHHELSAAGLVDASLDSLLRQLTRGGFPQLWAEPNFPLHLFFASYTGTYLERDVRHLLAVNSLRDFERFLRACAIRSGNLLNKSELAREVGVSVSTAGEWLGVLHALGHIVLLEPWFSNLGKRLSKSPKLFLSDVGLLCYLLGETEHSLLNSPAIGAIWETYVFGELRKQCRRIDRNLRLWFYRDQSQVEVDFIIEDGFQLSLYESKWSERPMSRDAQNLVKVAKIFDEAKKNPYRVNRRVVLSRASEEVDWHSGIELRPVFRALSQ